MIRARVTLNNAGGELDKKIVRGAEDSPQLSDAIKDAISSWTLTVGDTITVQEADKGERGSR